MVAHKKYKERVSVSLNTDRAIFNQFTDQCRKQGLTVSESITALMKESVQKNQVWALAGTPINISYKQHIKPPHIEPLDKYLEDHSAITTDYWRDYFRRKDSYEEVMRYEALTLTMYNQAKQRGHVLKTGRYLAQYH